MLEKLKEKWDEILLNLKEEHEITDVSFKTWLLPLKVHSINGDTVTVTVPDVEFLGYIRKKYGFLLKITIEEVTGFECNVDFVVENQVPQEEVPKAQTGNTLINNAMNTVSQSAIINANLNPKYSRCQQQSGPCCIVGGCRIPRRNLQPAFYLWRRGTRKNASDAFHRSFYFEK